jgi:hypothetical protein
MKWVQLFILLGPKLKEVFPLLLEIWDTFISNLESRLPASAAAKVQAMKSEKPDPDKLAECEKTCVEHCDCTTQEAKELCSQLPFVA